jgi:beta-galactosidase
LFNLTDDKSTNFSWNIYRMQIDENLLKWNNLVDTQQYLLPTLLKKDLVLDKVGDTYLDATELTKGYIFVNGRNLGRYWNKGPQKRLYCPGVWLKKGTNSIYVLELLYDGKQKGISGKLTLE